MSMLQSFLDISRSWGSTDEYETKLQQNRHADLVNKSCINEYNWTPEYTNRVLRGYQQFLELKSSMEDLDRDTIIPSPAVNNYWRRHILFTKAYQEDCNQMWGRLLHYNPDSCDPNSPNYNKRVKSTILALQARFGKHEIDEDVWDFRPTKDLPGNDTSMSSIMPSMSMRSTRLAPQDHLRSPRQTNRDQRQSTFSPRDSALSDSRQGAFSPREFSPRDSAPSDPSLFASPINPSATNGGSMTVTVRDQRGDEATFKVKPSTKMEKLMKAYAKLKNTSVGSLSFTTRNGREIFSNDTCERIGIKDGEVLFVS